MIYKALIRPLLFRFDAEMIHEHVNSMLDNKPVQAFFRFLSVEKYNKPKTVMGLQFPNPLGLAAGFDKNGEHILGLSSLGFGFIEIGTVTPRPQDGNARPRLFRLPEDQAIINRMGFNNKGVEYTLERLRGFAGKTIIGGNIGKNKTTENKRAVADYLICFKTLFEYVDYFTVNVSSPNTPNLRALQDKEALHTILSSLQHVNQGSRRPKPILLKIAPDMSGSALDEILEVTKENAIDGIIATNTTVRREGLIGKDREQSGGLSGKPLFEPSTEFVRYIKKHSDLVVVGVGGIFSAQDAREKIKAGADLLQIYTGLIYQGPFLIHRILKALYEADINK